MHFCTFTLLVSYTTVKSYKGIEKMYPFSEAPPYSHQCKCMQEQRMNQNEIPAGKKVCETDFGPEPFVIDIEKATKQNENFRTALWTGQYLQLTLMSIENEIGMEVHPQLDQFIRVEEGQGLVMMGAAQDQLNLQSPVTKDTAFIIPAGTWHNLVNTGNRPLKLYSIYAPPQHPFCTVHQTKEEAEEHEAK